MRIFNNWFGRCGSWSADDWVMWGILWGCAGLIIGAVAVVAGIWLGVL